MKDQYQSEFFSKREMNPRHEMVPLFEDDQHYIFDLMKELKGYGGHKEEPLIVEGYSTLTDAACDLISEFKGDVVLKGVKKLFARNLITLAHVEGKLDLSDLEEIPNSAMEAILYRDYETVLSEKVRAQLEDFRNIKRGSKAR